jgi:hypothetical protein
MDAKLKRYIYEAHFFIFIHLGPVFGFKVDTLTLRPPARRPRNILTRTERPPKQMVYCYILIQWHFDCNVLHDTSTL